VKTATAAEPPQCDLVPLEDQFEAAELAFVGRLRESQPAEGETRRYRFSVERPLKGPLGTEVEVVAPLLTDRDGTPLARNVPVGVLASLDGARVTTTSCGLIDAASLVSASEPQRGQRIKLVLGLLLAAGVVGLSVLRLRRRERRSDG
jgi:hypothetical protein